MHYVARKLFGIAPWLSALVRPKPLPLKKLYLKNRKGKIDGKKQAMKDSAAYSREFGRAVGRLQLRYLELVAGGARIHAHPERCVNCAEFDRLLDRRLDC